MRIRFQSPMLTTSDTAPMVQKCVRFETAPKTKASAKAPHTTVEASAAGSFKWRCPALLLLREALFGLLGSRAGGILLDQGAQGFARRAALADLGLRARDVEQRVGRLAVFRPQPHHLLLRGDRGLVVAHRVVGVADPVLRRGHQLAAREARHEVLEVGDRELVVAELELIKRSLVRLLLRGGAALALAHLVLELGLGLLDPAQAGVQVDVQVLLSPLDARVVVWQSA